MNGAPPGGGCHMNEDVVIPWLLQRSTILTALLAGLVPAMVANLSAFNWNGLFWETAARYC
jgi:hypothetical protein